MQALPTTTTRNADIQNLVALLQTNHARRLDVVAPASTITARGGQLVIAGTEAILGPDGVDQADGTYQPTQVCDGGLADRLNIPAGYLRRLRDANPDLWDHNINGWLAHPDYADRKYLVRCFRGDGGTGVARAFLSDSYKPIDNLDVLMATLDGIRQAGVQVQIDGCDLTDSNMRVRVTAPEVKVLAPVLLGTYRSPFLAGGIDRAGGGISLEQGRRAAAAHGAGYEPGAEPVVFAGFEVSNSETGQGAFSIAPRMVIQVCENGLRLGQALRMQHLGGKLEPGLIQWSADTEEKNLALVTAKARDAVRTFLDVDYITRRVAEFEAATRAPVGNPAEAVELVSKRLAFGKDTQAEILRHFTLGADATVAGLVNAVTSVAQTLADADQAAQLEADAVRIPELVG